MEPSQELIGTANRCPHDSLLYFDRVSEPPFNIPGWARSPRDSDFVVIPFYFESTSNGGKDHALMSGLTGRVLEIDERMARLLRELFRNDHWLQMPSTVAQAPSVKDLLEFLTEHSLALFLPAEAVN